MENKQLFTKVAVSILIGLNVGAFYVFWPHQDGGAKQATKKLDEDKGQTKLLPTKAEPGASKPEPKMPKPAELPPLASLPLSIPNPVKAELSPDEALNHLLDHIKRENVGGKDVPPAIPMFPEDVLKPAKDKDVGVTSPLMPKVPQGVWQVQTLPEKVGGQTQVVATLQQRTVKPVEFRILCDRMETIADGGCVNVTGNISFSGPGVKGVCQSIEIHIGNTLLVLLGNVSVTQEGDPGNILNAQRLVWIIPNERNKDIAPVILGPPK